MLTALIQKVDKLYIAKCREIGTVSQGYSIAEAIANLKEATELYLEKFPDTRFTHPVMITFDVAYTKKKN